MFVAQKQEVHRLASTDKVTGALLWPEPMILKWMRLPHMPWVLMGMASLDDVLGHSGGVGGPLDAS